MRLTLPTETGLPIDDVAINRMGCDDPDTSLYLNNSSIASWSWLVSAKSKISRPWRM